MPLIGGCFGRICGNTLAGFVFYATAAIEDSGLSEIRNTNLRNRRVFAISTAVGTHACHCPWSIVDDVFEELFRYLPLFGRRHKKSLRTLILRLLEDFIDLVCGPDGTAPLQHISAPSKGFRGYK